jgi:uncharacterized cupredoxin-like copper-binding protein
MKMISRIVLLIISVIVISAQAATEDTHIVNVKLWSQGANMGITTDLSSVKEGKISFNVVNESKTLIHEMLVVKVKDFTDALPYNQQEAKVYEDQVADFGEVSELEPGHSGNLTVNLKTGNYLLLCNISGHYKMGMFTKLRVTP